GLPSTQPTPQREHVRSCALCGTTGTVPCTLMVLSGGSGKMPSKTLDDISASIKKLKARTPKPKLHTYKVSIMGPSLDKHHIQTVQADTRGGINNIVLRANRVSACTHYAVLIITSDTPTEVI